MCSVCALDLMRRSRAIYPGRRVLCGRVYVCMCVCVWMDSLGLLLCCALCDRRSCCFYYACDCFVLLYTSCHMHGDTDAKLQKNKYVATLHSCATGRWGGRSFPASPVVWRAGGVCGAAGRSSHRRETLCVCARQAFFVLLFPLELV